MYFKIRHKLQELKQIAKQNRLLGQPKPKALDEFEQAQNNLGFWENKFFELWVTAQNWSGSEGISLDTLKVCCEDSKIVYCKYTRQIILMITQIYRSAQNG